MAKIIDLPLTSISDSTSYVPVYKDGVTYRIALTSIGGGGGVTDHGALTGLGDDDHIQYHNDARGDARYSLLGHTHSASVITNTPAGNIAATNIQAAINELDTEKINTSVGQIAGLRNKIINGDFIVWQRGTSFTTGNIYTADRWAAAGAAGQTVSRVADHPTAGSSGYCLEISNTSGSQWVYQRIESINIRDLVGKTVTASCWVRAIALGGPMQLQIIGANALDNWAATTYVGGSATSTSSSWVQLTYSFTVTSDMVNGLMMRIITSGGSGGGSTVRVSSAQLEVGPSATPFEARPYGLELALCQRYLPAVTGGDTTAISVAAVKSSTQIYLPVYFPVEARVKPTGVTVTNPAMITFETPSGAILSTSITTTGAQSTKVGLLNVAVTGATAGQGVIAYFNGNAGASGSILFTGCEL